MKNDGLSFQTVRLLLRDFKIDDVDRVHAYASIPSVCQYENWGPNSELDSKNYVSLMVEQAALKNRYNFDLAICLESTGLLIGSCGIRRESEASSVANLGWIVHPVYQGRGFASEAAHRLIQFGFQDLHLHVIYATCDARNLASARVMQKIGLNQVGLLRGDRLQKGVLRDTFRYEITRPAHILSFVKQPLSKVRLRD